MLPSIEMRWFQRGRIPPASEESIERWPYPPAVDTRADTYLVDPTSELGIKLRAGKNLEIKQRTTDEGLFRAGPLEGRVERWVKWSFPLVPDPKSPPDIRRSPGAWIEVGKNRHTRKYAVDAAGTVSTVKPDERPPAGANFELTSLSLEGQDWWTIGLEAFGPDAQLSQILKTVVQGVATEPGCPTLRPADSLSYPAWLRVALNRT